MPLFEFRLKEIEDIIPWGGEESDLSLSWFELSDSVYYMDVRGKHLFKYTQSIRKHWESLYPDSGCNAIEYTDYQVARLHEDLLEILPNVLQPIPEKLLQYVNTIESQRELDATISKVLADSTNPELDDLCFDARYWTNARYLDSGYLIAGPHIFIFRVGEQICVRWDNRQCEIDGIQPWEEESGEAFYSIEQFMNEVKSFHHRLMSDMQSRVDQYNGLEKLGAALRWNSH